MAHYYSEDQDTPLNPFQILVRVRGLELPLWTGSGVFSKDRLDNGTRLLLERMVIEEGWSVHDLGCGYGVVGLVVKRLFPRCTVLCSDVSRRAVTLTRMNVRGTGITVRRSAGYERVPELFDTVLLNPPYVAGRKVVFSLIEGAARHLTPGGMLQVVARHRKGGEMIKRKIEELFGSCDDSRKGSGFRVYIGKNRG